MEVHEAWADGTAGGVDYLSVIGRVDSLVDTPDEAILQEQVCYLVDTLAGVYDTATSDQQGLHRFTPDTRYPAARSLNSLSVERLAKP